MVSLLLQIKIATAYRKKFKYTGYFTSDNEPDGTENATHNTFPKSWIFLIQYPDFLLMYCGLHFQFRRAHYHITRQIFCITIVLNATKNTCVFNTKKIPFTRFYLRSVRSCKK
jgi:hypothetical protein